MPVMGVMQSGNRSLARAPAAFVRTWVPAIAPWSSDSVCVGEVE